MQKKNKKKKIIKFIKHNKFSLLIIILLMVITIGFQIFNKSYALSEPVTGTSGTCTWTIDTNGKLTIEPTSGDNSCTLAQMQTEVTGSNTATTWVPAYSVTYDGNGGTINSNNTLVKTYRIGSKINTKNVTPIKTSYDFIKWTNTQTGTSANITINKNGESANAYGTKYSTSNLTNGNITLYAQYNLPVSDVEFIKQDNVTGDPVSGATFSLTGTSDAGTSVSKTATSENNGKVTFTDVPFGTYRIHETTVPSGYSSSNLRDFTVTVTK